MPGGLLIGSYKSAPDDWDEDQEGPLLTDIKGRAIVVIEGTLDVEPAAGAATEAKQDTQITHLDGLEALLTTIDGRVDTLETLIASTNTKLDTAITGLGQIEAAVEGDLKVVSGADEWETVAASQTDQVAGATGAAGDYLAAVLIIPETTSPGEVSIEDGATNIVIFVGGADSVSNLVPFRVDLGLRSLSGGWEISTGANVRAIAIGDFT